MSEVNSFGPWAGFGIETVREAILKIRSLAGQATEVVERRAEGYREFDPEVIRVDKVAEELVVERLRASGMRATLLSEEAGRLEIAPAKASSAFPEPAYVICDPFDGSYLYRRQIPTFWFTSLSIYSQQGEPLASVVGDVINGEIDFANEEAAFSCRLVGENLAGFRRLAPSTETELGKAYLEAYLMKPHRLCPDVPRLSSLFEKVLFILPNGGPAGWADVAKGRVDLYLAVAEACTEVFTGLPIAQKAGAVVSTWKGEPVAFDADINKTYSILCSANPTLHEQALAVLKNL